MGFESLKTFFFFFSFLVIISADGCLVSLENLYQHQGTDLLLILTELSGEQMSLAPALGTAAKSIKAFLGDLQGTQLIPQNCQWPKMPHGFVQSTLLYGSMASLCVAKSICKSFRDLPPLCSQFIFT